MNSPEDTPCSHGVGFPIRKSPDHRLLASPRGLSQLATSFIAFLRQGIHTHALSSLTIKFTLDTEYSRFDLQDTRNMSRTLEATYCFILRYRPPHNWFRGDLNLQLCSCPSIFNCQRSSIYKRQRSDSRCHGHLATDSCTSILVGWWAWIESNYRPHPYQGCALAN
jgi:hypothetical protein